MEQLLAGMYSFYQKEDDLFGVPMNDRSRHRLSQYAGQRQRRTGGVLCRRPSAAGPVRHAAGRRALLHLPCLARTRRAIYPRIGATVRIPRLNWVLRGFYGHFFQPAPILTVSSSVLNYAGSLPGGENAFTPIPSERDEEHQFGIEIPYRGWMLDVDTFKNRVNNFLDHSNLGESNMYFPIAVDGALVRAWEMTLRSPQLGRMGSFTWRTRTRSPSSAATLSAASPAASPPTRPATLARSYFPVDHDQRDTLNTGFTANLPQHTWFASNVYYGSGFSNGLAGSGEGPYQANYLPVHTTFDSSIGHAFGEKLEPYGRGNQCDQSSRAVG